MSKKLVRLDRVRDKTGLCTSAIYQGMRDGWFPRNFPITAQARAWDEAEIDAWIEAKIAAGRAAEVA
jgi:prophage regulatory protein